VFQSVLCSGFPSVLFTVASRASVPPAPRAYGSSARVDELPDPAAARGFSRGFVSSDGQERSLPQLLEELEQRLGSLSDNELALLVALIPQKPDETDAGQADRD
jgi:hypothetical protein